MMDRRLALSFFETLRFLSTISEYSFLGSRSGSTTMVRVCACASVVDHAVCRMCFKFKCRSRRQQFLYPPPDLVPRPPPEKKGRTVRSGQSNLEGFCTRFIPRVFLKKKTEKKTTTRKGLKSPHEPLRALHFVHKAIAVQRSATSKR